VLNEFSKSAIDLLEQSSLLLEVLSQSLETGDDNKGRFHLVETIREQISEARKALSPE
jgi:hypothetical protein